MRVKAIKVGYYGIQQRAIGDIFTLKSEKDFSERWMVKLSNKKAPVADEEVEDSQEDSEETAI